MARSETIAGKGIKQLNVPIVPSLYKMLKAEANRDGIKLYRLVGNIIADHYGIRQNH